MLWRLCRNSSHSGFRSHGLEPLVERLPAVLGSLRGKAEDEEKLFESDELAPAEPTLPATAEARDTSLAEPEPALESAFEPALEPD